MDSCARVAEKQRIAVGVLAPMAVLFCAILAQSHPQWFALTRDHLSSDMWHTLWTGHLLHWTLSHFIWDSMMMLVFGFLVVHRDGLRQTLLLCLLSSPLLVLLSFVIDHSLQEYRGLSGIDTLLFTRFCLGNTIQHWNTDRPHAIVFGLLPLLALSSKTLYEWTSGNALFATDLGEGVEVMYLIHIAGILFALLWSLTISHQPRCSSYST